MNTNTLNVLKSALFSLCSLLFMANVASASNHSFSFSTNHSSVYNAGDTTSSKKCKSGKCCHGKKCNKKKEATETK